MRYWPLPVSSVEIAHALATDRIGCILGVVELQDLGWIHTILRNRAQTCPSRTDLNL